DPCRNTNTCRRIFTWRQDTTAPTFTKCPGNTNLGCNPITIPDCDTNSSNVTATDDCGEPPIITCSRLDFTNGCVRTRRLVYTATDLCGNAKTCTQNITWTVDTNAPTLVNCPAATLDLGCNPTNIPTCSTYNVTAADTCGAASVTCTNFTVTNGCA